MHPVTLSFLWHFHQPIYRDARLRRMWMPWARLHGVKDYTGMALLLEEFPEIRCTANFSPALLLQLEAYAAGETDSWLELLRKPAELTADERERLLDRFFLAHPQTVIGAHPRYEELRRKRAGRHAFSDPEIVDLQTLANLAWFHPLVRDPEIEALREKGRNFAEADRDRVVAKQREVLARIIPRWKALQPRVEISVSPFAHPILPLLCDFRSSGFPRLPDPIPGLRDDADLHVARAAEWGERHFGVRPCGMWPSEGSVSEETCRVAAKHGFRWLATDEEILAESLGRKVTRQDVYRPWKYGDTVLAFRDLELSNLLSFSYKTWPPADAARDFVRRVESAPEGSHVFVILDGENPWEHYPGGGVDFLRALFGALSKSRAVRTAPVSAALEREAAPLPRLAAGSWINHNFGIWIGHEEDVRAWNLLGRVRAELARAGGPPEAWESLYAAEGSDWYWWFGEDFSTPQDLEFDALFRRHLANVFRSLGRPEPEWLLQPVKRKPAAEVVRPPWAILNVVLDGRRTDYFEWIAAGTYDLSREYGAMAGDLAFLSDLFYGFDESNLLVRLDFRSDPRKAMEGRAVRVVLTRPHPKEASIWPGAALDDILEAAVPFEALGLSPDQEAEFFLEFSREGGAPARLPTTQPLTFRVPSKDFERINWTA